MPLRPKPEIESMVRQGRSPHGGINYAELEALGIRPEDILDFSANLNPFGPPPEVREHLGKVDISHYPDTEAITLRKSLAESLNVGTENILAGNGSTEIIRLAMQAYLAQGDRVLIIEPTFGEYEDACRIAGAEIIKQRLSPANDFQLDLTETEGLGHQHKPKAIFLCNPNNPTGRYLDRSNVKRLLEITTDSLMIIDEAYLTFVDYGESSIELIEKGNVLVLRSMTKDYALAGLRLGYGVANEEIIATLRCVCPPWNVNALAQEAGVIAVRQEQYLEQCRQELIKAKDYLIKELSGLGLPPLPSEANFFLVKVGNAYEFRQKLLRKGMLVRDCTSFGLPEYIRIAPRTMPECKKLVEAVREIYSQGN